VTQFRVRIAAAMPTLEHTIEIDAPPQEVWRILTTPELVREWAAAYREGVAIRTNWREGAPVTWTAPKGAAPLHGKVAAFRPESFLQFDYPEDPGAAGSPAVAGPYSEAYRISADGPVTRLTHTAGPLTRAGRQAIEDPSHQALEEIKSLAEESARIHGLR
jgi:uncharacterized protein YndB with AHSA1/START domain